MTDVIKDVHTEHCCAQHGCKYADSDCPVASGNKPQSYPCESCEWEKEEAAHATAAKDAEIERLRAEVETLRDGLDYLRQMQGAPDVLELRAKAARAERLAEALRGIRREALDGCSAMDCARDARDALSDNGFAVDGICGQSAMAATAEEAAAALEAEREDGVMQRFADMLLGVLNDTQDALGFTDEDKACPNGSIEIVAAINELREDAERYRWLVESGKFCPSYGSGGWGLSSGGFGRSSKADLDAAIDAAREARNG